MKSSRERKELTGLDGGSQVSRGRGKAEGAPRFAVGSVRELRGEGEGRGWQRRGVVQTLEVCPRPQLRSCREEVGGAAAVAIGEEKGQAAPVSEDGGRRPSWRRKPWRQSPLSAGLKGNAPCCAASPRAERERARQRLALRARRTGSQRVNAASVRVPLTAGSPGGSPAGGVLRSVFFLPLKVFRVAVSLPVFQLSRPEKGLAVLPDAAGVSKNSNERTKKRCC
ncbi:uncharacterized protein LOC123806845 isoform X1 [Phyllostomus hastatus]|uniref:uncharacterized protein LOC123806845 isoform X1 n=1 Tax=Phyllostomus hastatus TaxID=9423 RepID=UPI001E68380C|nr:uncharacterized protein LOC123806845 isoform X1 [Phyllostomus hastatus]